MSDMFEESQWADLPICCPHCGNHGEPEGEWQANAWTPFKLIKEVVRSWEFTAVSESGKLRLSANALDEQLGETDLRIECMQCFGSFAIPEGAEVQFV